ncbi:MAG TPA: phosphoribosylanthranilate isomerase [Alcanivorax sp.]|jgi:phosphoribosylanthranilate isomerase|uniref:N-(5'-phosphoribosyl)anthranilate isomerase n=1 Tax=Alloalcanivorax venustensis ISO4 TaxID=1177184 RepID=A0ABS0AJH1_9GAMM|nr:phosphoribosylanthranilate isomerase [Alloalcanivorax venustensis]MBU60225.1 phosphoribosylanthranilate isomerase [Alcanivorax sp.]MCH9783913.1 phosphoribosylanthranilate isomerase [Gammaproteobacteria bacterium]MEA3260220.1 phosphoribosylanthranilate isomerase [Pseudomonadota bacterium]SMO76019.1 phosphoribosylanthranilate isomerase [Alcanivorax sp. DSM 26295]MBF5054282.1 N-(5'-phosphoribosyl)anthranilate isomerase [Alloalcanivorax venustensis ISO4]|tara:strand:+ start:1337 stop:1981 length:645 start_codon:yes stop_codon:yes gene_type:complete
MNIPRVKICGITRPDDGRHAARAGADAIGLVFYPPSPRYVSPRQAADIVAALPPFVTTVGLFVDAPPEQIAALLEQVPLDMLQFHGDESPEYCAAFQRPWIKALRMRDGVDPRAEAERYGAAGARGLLVDSYVPGVPGGTGERFDWDRLPADPSLPLVLAGGLDPANVAEAVRRVRPWAVDVSGGVEVLGVDGRRQGGIKDPGAVSAFIRAARG